ncbi:hypothetical protein ABZ215_14570 [Amycolatopsis sp. NPDC006131]
MLLSAILAALAAAANAGGTILQRGAARHERPDGRLTVAML